MSSDKEFEWTDSENFKHDPFQAFFDHEFNFDDKNQKRQNRQSFETAWNHQQTKLNAKDKEIERLKKENERLKLYNIAMKACIVGLDKQILRVEDADDNQTQQREIRKLCEFLNDERQVLRELGEVESER